MSGSVDVLLASASATRLDMLQRAGIPVTAEPAAVDESEIKASMRAEGAGVADVAEMLAELKARRLRPARSDTLVIGADQMLECDEEWFDKPRDRDEARTSLCRLRGRKHTLVTSAVVVRNGGRIWHHTDRADLVMRDFSDEFLDAYLTDLGDGVLGSVGCYRLEGPGAQLFTSVHGDFFTILGLPLLPLLDLLRSHGVVRS